MAGTERASRDPDALAPPHTRVAVLGDGGSFEVLDVSGDDFRGYADRLVALVSRAFEDRGSAVPALALRELVDNLVHALPCSVSLVLEPDAGNIFLSDTGPGIARLDLAFELGYSTADIKQRAYIRGVGIGLHLAREDMRSRGGELLIESEVGVGTYAQLSMSSASPPESWDESASTPRLTQRQNNILFLLSEGDPLGPSQVSAELNIGVSTAHRDLVKLQDIGLIFVDKNGKRFLSEIGRSYLQSLLSL